MTYLPAPGVGLPIQPVGNVFVDDESVDESTEDDIFDQLPADTSLILSLMGMVSLSSLRYLILSGQLSYNSDIQADR